MNKLLQTTLIVAVLSTSVMASGNNNYDIYGSITIENALNINENASNYGTLDFTPGGHGHIADDVTLSQWGTIKLGQAEDATAEDLATINVTKVITTEVPAEGENPATQITTTYYQYRYTATDDIVKYVWSSKDNATKDDSDLIADIADTSVAAAISDYQSGWGLVQGMSGGTITGGRISQNGDSDRIDINTDARYEVNAGYSLEQDTRTLNLKASDPEKAFMDGYEGDKKKILGKDNSGGLFSPDIFNPEVLSKVTKNDRTLGDVSKNGLDPQKLSSQTEVKDYLYEWHITMHKGTEDIAYEEREDNTIIEVLARTTSDQAVAIPDELGKDNGEIVVKMPVWDKSEGKPDYVTDDHAVTIAGNLHNIGYENETLTITANLISDDQSEAMDINLTGDNRYLKGTINLHVGTLRFNGENSIPGGVTNCYLGMGLRAGTYDGDTNQYTSSAIVPEGATFNIVPGAMGDSINGKLVVKGVMNIGAPKTTETSNP